VNKFIWLCLTLTVALGAHAQSKQFKKWTVAAGQNGSVFAATINDSGGIFGQYCFPESGACYYLVALSSSCEKDGKYSVLANTDQGTAYLEMSCFGPLENSGLHQYVLNDFEA
jgi:hypothetical protein